MCIVQKYSKYFWTGPTNEALHICGYLKETSAYECSLFLQEEGCYASVTVLQKSCIIGFIYYLKHSAM